MRELNTDQVQKLGTKVRNLLRVPQLKGTELVDTTVGNKTDLGLGRSIETLIVEIDDSEKAKINPTRDDINLIYNNCQKYGGSFAQAMALALRRADDGNERKLIHEFGDLYAKYLLM